MSEEVMRQHIQLYVNDYSVDLQEEGRNAVQQLYKIYRQQNSGITDAAPLFN